MNDIQALIDRQLGNYYRLSYDNVLKRLVVDSEESFYGLQNSLLAANFDQDPPIFACRFSEAPGYEHILALANEDGRVAIQDTSTVASASTLEGFQCHNNAVFDLAWMPGYMNFVTVSGDHTACLWDVGEAGPRRLQVFAHHTRSVKTAAFRPGAGGVFASGARDGHVLVWDLRAPPAPALALRPHCCLRNCHSPAPRTARRDPRAVSVTGLAFRDPLTLLSCGECDGNIKLWDLRKTYSATLREPLPRHSIPYCGSSTRNGYTNLIVDDARVRLYASCMDNVIYCFNVATDATLPERRYVGHENGTFYIKTSLSPDGQYLVSGSSDKNAYVWNVRHSEPVVRLAGHWAEVTCAAWCRRGDAKIVTCSDDARHKIWRVGRESPEPGAEHRGRAEPVPRADGAALPAWGCVDRTPGSLKRKRGATPGSRGAKRPRPAPAARTKRCLAALLGDAPAKRPRAEPERDAAWCAAGATPTKRARSPPSPKPLSPSTAHNRSPVRVSPTKVRIISYGTPTKNLPNYAVDGEAPHLRLMSPVRRRREAPDWLTLMARSRRAPGAPPPPAPGAAPPPPGTAPAPAPAPASPNENAPARRASATERTPKAAKRSSRTLLKYFTVISKEKS